MIILADDLKRWPAASGYIEVRFIHRLQDQYPKTFGTHLTSKACGDALLQ
jgi:hypothetical protein